MKDMIHPYPANRNHYFGPIDIVYHKGSPYLMKTVLYIHN